MKKEIISGNQGIALIVLFIMGSSLIIGIGSEAGKDTWLSIILSILLSIPILMIYAKLLSLFPKKDLFDILEEVLGKFLGKIIILLYIWFTFHLGALVLRNFSEFATTVSLVETPETILMIFMAFLCVLGMKAGIEVLSRFGEFVLIVLIFLIILSTMLLIPNMEFNNIKPVLSKGINPILKGTFSVFAFPFAETVIFCFVFSALNDHTSPYKVYIFGLIIGGAIILSTTFTNLLVLGEISYTTKFFPSYTTVRRTNIGNLIQRSEVIVAASFLVTGFIKICMCILATCKGIVKLFGYTDYRFIVIPIVLLMLNLSYLVYDNIIEMSQWAFTTWHYYAFPFQVIIPIIVWITAEIKKKLGKI